MFDVSHLTKTLPEGSIFKVPLNKKYALTAENIFFSSMQLAFKNIGDPGYNAPPRMRGFHAKNNYALVFWHNFLRISADLNHLQKFETFWEIAVI